VYVKYLSWTSFMCAHTRKRKQAHTHILTQNMLAHTHSMPYSAK